MIAQDVNGEADGSSSLEPTFCIFLSWPCLMTLGGHATGWDKVGASAQDSQCSGR